MSNKVDERVVELKFNTKQFEDGVKKTSENVDKLNETLKMEGIAQGVDKISSKFSVFGAIGFTAIQTLTNAAIGFGGKIAGAVLDPLVEGGRKRALNIEQAKFQFKGLGMDVEQSMADALYAVKGTAFGLDEAAVAASQFGASGIKSGTEMQNALRGISGVAAMAGSSYSDMANVFTKVAGQGRLMGDDLNRLGTRGINAASTLAKYLNETGEAANATEADVRAMVTKGQIDFNTFAMAMSDAFGEHATAANETFTGSLSNMRAALARIGAMYFTPHLERSRWVFNALTPAIDAVADAVTPLIEVFNKFADQGAKNLVAFIESINFGPVIRTFRLLSKSIENISNFVIKLFKPVGAAFKEVFGDSNVLLNINMMAASFYKFTESLKVNSKAAQGIRTVFVGIFSVIKTVITVVKFLGSIFMTVFGALWKVVSSFLSIFQPLLSIFRSFQTSTRETSFDVMTLADKFKYLMDKIVSPLTGFFEKLRKAIDGVVSTKLKSFADDATDSLTPLEWVVEKIVAMFEGLKSAATAIWNTVQPIFTAIKDTFVELTQGFKDFGSDVNFGAIFGAANVGVLFYFANAIKNIFAGGLEEVQKITGIFDNISEIFGGVTGVLEGMQSKLKAQALVQIAIAIGILAASMFLLGTIKPDNIGPAVIGMATVVTAMVAAMAALDKLTSMKSAAKLPFLAGSLVVMATAILLLALALKIMATMSWDEIGRGLTVLAGGLGILVGALLLLSKASLKAVVGAAALALIASTLLILAITLKIMATMSWEEIGKGLVTLAGGLLIMVGAVMLLSLIGPSVIIAAVALVLVASTILILAAALKIMATMSWSEIGTGLVALAGGLLIMVGAMLLLGLVGPMALIGAAALIIVAGAIGILVLAIFALGSMDMGALMQGLIGLTAAILVMVGAVLLLGLVGPMAIVGAAAILIMSAAILILTVALTALSLLPAEGIAVAIGTISAALGILFGFGLLFGVLSPILMAGAIVLGILSLAMLVVAGAMAIFALALGIFGANAPAAAEGIKILGDAVTEVLWSIPLLAGMGVALIAFGAGALVAGVGISILAVGFALMAGALALLGLVAPIGTAALIMMTIALVSIAKEGLKLAGVALVFTGLGAALLILGAGALVAGAGLLILAAGMRAISISGTRGTEVLSEMVKTIAKMTKHLIGLGLMAVGFTALGASLLVMGAGALLAGTGLMLFVTGLLLVMTASKGATVGFKAVESAMLRLAPVIPLMMAIGVAMGLVGANFMRAGQGSMMAAAGILAMVAATSVGATAILNLASTIATAIPRANTVMMTMPKTTETAAKSVVRSVKGIGTGIRSSSPDIVSASTTIIRNMTNALVSTMSREQSRLYSQARTSGMAIPQGLAAGINTGSSIAVNAAIRVAANALAAAKRELDIRSPSRKFHEMGEQSDQGFALGMLDNAYLVEDAATDVAGGALSSLRDGLKNASEITLDNIDVDPTIRPVMDLTDIYTKTAQLHSIMNANRFDLSSSLELSRNIASGVSAARAAEEERMLSEAVRNETNLTFNQSISSPKPISEAETYRQTKNQLSVAKGVFRDVGKR